MTNSSASYGAASVITMIMARLRKNMKQLYAKDNKINAVNQHVGGSECDIPAQPNSQKPVRDFEATHMYDDHGLSRQLPENQIISNITPDVLREAKNASPLDDTALLQYFNSVLLQQMPDRFAIGRFGSCEVSLITNEVSIHENSQGRCLMRLASENCHHTCLTGFKSAHLTAQLVMLDKSIDALVNQNNYTFANLAHCYR